MAHRFCMKRIAACTAIASLLLLVIFCGCTGTQPAPQPTPAPVTVAETPGVLPTATPDPYPGASALNTPLAFGTGAKTGEMTVTDYKITPVYTFFDPSWNSPREQAEFQGAFETQKGYSTKQAADGNIFVFVYLKVEATGTESAWAPSPYLVTMESGGKPYQYSSLTSPKTTVNGEFLNQYDFEFGDGGTGGLVKPGKSNAVKGFLIYEVPEPFVPEKTYIIATPGASDTKTIWKLA